MEVESALLAEPDPLSADSLVSTNDPDDLANEQTWPTEEEMNEAGVQPEDDIPEAVEGTTPKRVRRIPKGMSEYQATWIVDDDDEEETEEDGENGEDGEMKAENHDEEEMQDVTMDETQMDIDQGEKVHFQDLDIHEEEKEYVLLYFF
jgi:pre-rRNA-processing protein TSR1